MQAPQLAMPGNLGGNTSTISSQLHCLHVPCWEAEWPFFFQWGDCMELPILAKAVVSYLEVCNCVWWGWE